MCSNRPNLTNMGSSSNLNLDNFINCMLVNARSLNNRTIDNLFNILLVDEKVDVCCITETWLKPSDQVLLAEIKSRGYQIVSSPRASKKRGGGVAFICRNLYQYSVIKTPKYKFFELLEVVLKCKTSHIRFSTIYRTGVLNVNDRHQFLEELNNYLDTLVSKEGINVIWGDFNISKDQKANKVFYPDFIDTFNSKAFKLVIDKPTHIKKGILDLVFLQRDFNIKDAKIFDLGSGVEVSDHFPIKLEIPAEVDKKSEYTSFKIRNFKNLDMGLFKSQIDLKLNVTLGLSAPTTNTIDQDLDILNKTLEIELDKQAPLKTRIKKISKHLVSNSEIKNARLIKRKAERKFKKTGLELDKAVLRAAKKSLNRFISSARNKFFKEKFDKCKGNVKETYKIFNKLMNRAQQTIFPTHSSELILANKFSKFYYDKIRRIRGEFLLDGDESDIKVMEAVKVDFPLENFEQITYEEIFTITKSLLNKQSMLDVVPCKLFKQVVVELLPTLFRIISNSFQLGVFPSGLKVSTLTPVIKSKNVDPDILGNYRPVSNLSLISKIIEKCALSQLNKHLELNQLSPLYQSAYRVSYSCETAIVKLMDDVFKSFDKNSYTVMTFLDFSAAFDTVDHGLLISKLEYKFGIKGIPLKWFKSYLDGRYYKVKINSTLSEDHPLLFGVPQGSILGPILYSMYVKEIEAIAFKHNVNIHVYADDVVVYATCRNIINLQECLTEINLWAKSNFLKLNKSKTKVMCLSSKSCKLVKPKCINVMGETIPVENTVKYLGVWLDENLCMSKQVSSLCSQGYLTLRNLWHMSSKVTSIRLRTKLVNTNILSKLNYCNAVYAGLPKKQLHKLDKLLKSSARFVFKICGRKLLQNVSITPFLQKLKLLPMSYRSQFKINLLVYKSLNGQGPSYLKSLLMPHKSLRVTRKDNDTTWLDKFSVDNTTEKSRSFSHVAPYTWNRLSQEIRESTSVTSFKSKLKRFYLNDWIDNS